MSLLESKIEGTLINAVKKRGGICWKLTGYKGMPDRLVLLPGNIVKFIETKRLGEDARKSQEVVHKELRTLGFEVWVLDNKDLIEEILEWKAE